MKNKEEKVEKFYLARGVEFIDLIFDNGYFHENVERKDLRALDNYLGYLFESHSKSAVKSSELVRKIREIK